MLVYVINNDVAGALRKLKKNKELRDDLQRYKERVCDGYFKPSVKKRMKKIAAEARRRREMVRED